jgi:heme oxygenase (biliverdin-IX-beta and delta-forming)
VEKAWVDVVEAARRETTASHRALEQRFAHLVKPTLDLASYRATVQCFHAFYGPLEAQLARMNERTSALPLRPMKVSWLEVDVAYLGIEPVRGVLPAIPRVDSVAAAFGCMYVLEGATLGGQIIGRNLRATLGIGPTSGGRFFHGYGGETGAQWKGFLAALGTLPAPCHSEAVDASVRIFRGLLAWSEVCLA